MGRTKHRVRHQEKADELASIRCVGNCAERWLAFFDCEDRVMSSSLSLPLLVGLIAGVAAGFTLHTPARSTLTRSLSNAGPVPDEEARIARRAGVIPGGKS